MYFLPAYRRGVFNRYRKGMPWPEMLAKDAGVVWQRLGRRMRGKPHRVLLCYPHFPSRGSTIYKIAGELDMEVTNKLGRAFDLAMYWEYATQRTEFGALEAKGVRAINLHNRDISKDVVDRAMRKAFGYQTMIDPTDFQGVAVRKSVQNAVHDGTKVQCPVKPEQGYIYQKLIDSATGAGEVMDYRVPIIGGHIPFIYLNFRSIDAPFKNVPDRAEWAQTADHLSAEEQAQILAFCEEIRLEFGELDVLRDRVDGRIYVVDANNTPQGPPKHLAAENKRKAIEALSKVFTQSFLASS